MFIPSVKLVEYLCYALLLQIEKGSEEISWEGNFFHAKVVYMVKLLLVRHAESVNNVDKGIARRAWSNFKSTCSLPSCSEWRTIGHLLTFPMDSDVSPEGLKMIEVQRRRLQEHGILEKYNVRLIIHSHLKRARKTCEGLFSPLPMQVHSGIFEKDIAETLGINSIQTRVNAFVESVLAQPADATIVVLGHSAFFRCLLSTDVHMENCEVRLCELSEIDGTILRNDLVLEGGRKVCCC